MSDFTDDAAAGLRMIRDRANVYAAGSLAELCAVDASGDAVGFTACEVEHAIARAYVVGYAAGLEFVASDGRSVGVGPGVTVRRRGRS